MEENTGIVSVLRADHQAPGLEISQIGVGSQFTIPAISREPAFKVIFFIARCTHVAHTDVDDTVGDPEALEEIFDVLLAVLMPMFGFFRQAKDDLFDFMELMNAEDTPCLLPVTSRFRSETGRKCRELAWQFGEWNHFFGIKGNECLL